MKVCQHSFAETKFQILMNMRNRHEITSDVAKYGGAEICMQLNMPRGLHLLNSVLKETYYVENKNVPVHHSLLNTEEMC